MPQISDITLTRIKSGFVIAFFLYSCVFLGKWLCATVLCWLFWHGSKEFLGLSDRSNTKDFNRIINFLVLGHFFAAAFAPNILYAWFVTSSLFIFCLYTWKCFKENVCMRLNDLSSSVFCLLYCGFFPAHFVLLRFLNDGDAQSSLFISYLFNNFTHIELQAFLHLSWKALTEKGVLYTLLAVMPVFMSDIMAYWIGRKYGKNKLITSVSPNKTIEGAIGGLLGSVFIFIILSMIGKVLCNFDIPWIFLIIMAIVLNILGQVGDLIESMMKRTAQVKDTGHLIEGQGGVLDRFDSHILVIPAFYYIVYGLSFLI